jgi:hypothetical protein
VIATEAPRQSICCHRPIPVLRASGGSALSRGPPIAKVEAYPFGPGESPAAAPSWTDKNLQKIKHAAGSCPS